jgi:cytochrome bd ubiquinol oxidase subunit II
MEAANVQNLLSHAWFGLIGLMLIFYVITDGFDLGIGMLTLIRSNEADRDLMIQSIGPVWDANETWLVVLGGALFGAFPEAYATLLSKLYIPIMALIASFIMRGAAIEFRHAASTSKPIWDRVFGIGSLLAAICQGVILGKVITGLLPGALELGFVAVTAIGVVSGYALLGSGWLIKKTTGTIQDSARRYAIVTVFTTIAAAIVLSLGTMHLSPIGAVRWTDNAVFNVLTGLGVLAVFAFCYILYAVRTNGENGPFNGAIALFFVSLAGLVISLFPYIVPGGLTVAAAASNSGTLVFMLFGIGTMLPVMIGYNLYQYHLFRGKLVPGQH